MTITGRICSQLSQVCLYHQISTKKGRLILRPCATRMLSMTSPLHAKSRKPPDEDDEEPSKPIKFSTSKASHRSWSVDRSLGSTHQRPWWKVLPISVIAVGFLLWCAFRKETEIDESLEKHLYEHLPELLPDEEEDDVKNKP